MGHLYGLVGVLVGHMQGNSGNAALHRPDWTPDSHNFLDRPLGTLVRFDSFGANLSANRSPQTSRLAGQHALRATLKVQP